ncbi:MAG: hypothetical protein ACK533_15020, partial [Planctomycetota bacterium]
MAQLDPTKIKVQSNALPVWETEVTFQELMAERLRAAPWFMLSLGIHVVVALIAYLAMPAKKEEKVVNKVEMTQQEETKVEEPPPPPPP